MKHKSSKVKNYTNDKSFINTVSIFVSFRNNFLDIDFFMKELYYEEINQQIGYDIINLWGMPVFVFINKLICLYVLLLLLLLFLLLF